MIKHLDKHFISIQLYGVNFNLVEWLADEKYNPPKDSLDEMFLSSISTLASNISRNLFDKVEGKITISVKDFLDNLKDRITQAEIENVVEDQYKKYILDVQRKPVDCKSDISISAEFVKNKYKESIGQILLRKINLKELDFESSKRLLIPQQNKPARIIEPPLFSDRNLEPTPSCAIVDTVFTFCVGKTLAWEKLTGELATKKKFANGTVELIIKQVEETILHEYGLDTVKVFYTLMSYSLKHKNSLTEFITVSGWELLSYLNKQSMRDNCKGLKS